MNSGIFCVYVAIVFAILFESGWGDRYVRQARISRRGWAGLLLLIGLLSQTDVSVGEVAVNLATVLVLLCALLYMIIRLNWKQKFIFVLAAVTASACCFTLMVVVPHDPAFYFINDMYLYPISSVCAASLFSRNPLLTMTAAVSGVITAGLVFDNRFAVPFTGMVSAGSEDLMELVMVGFVASYLLNNSVAIVELMIKRFNRGVTKLDGDPS